MNNKIKHNYFRIIFLSLTEFLACISLFSVGCAAQSNVVWIADELSKGISQTNLDEWNSSNMYLCSGDNTLMIKNKTNLTSLSISKTYKQLPPHAFVLLQIQVFQLDEFIDEEGLVISIDNQQSSVIRYQTVSKQSYCGDNRIDQIYSERFGVVHTAQNLTLSFKSIIKQLNTSKVLALNNLKLGVIPCEKTCAQCKLNSIPSQNLTDLTCTQCPDNAIFTFNTNICACVSDYAANFDLGYMQCVKKPIQVIDITSKCIQEISDYSTRSRVFPVTQILTDSYSLQKYAWITLYTYSYFPVVSAECQPVITFDIQQYNNATLAYLPINRKYVRNQVQGDTFEIAYLLSEIPSLSNYLFVDSSKDFLYAEMHLRMKYSLGTNITRTHVFKLIYTQQKLNQLANTFNFDYSKNMNFIQLGYYYNPPVVIDEYNLELKRYLCTDNKCQYTRSNLGYYQNEDVISRISFKMLPSNKQISLNSAQIYVDNNSSDIFSQIKVLEQNAGYITLSFPQMQQYSPQYGSSYNQVYLQITVTYLDNNNKNRIGQITLIYYALKPARILSNDDLIFLRNPDYEDIDSDNQIY